MKVRRVVTGHDADGKAVVAADTEIDGFRPRIDPGSELHVLWGADTVPELPDDGAIPPFVTYFPPLGGFRFGMFTIPPRSSRSERPLDRSAAAAEFEAALPGLTSHMEPDAPGMHRTATVDMDLVLEGEVWLELDDGVTVHLGPGDVVVQNGTRHAWRNRGDVPCRLAVFIVGARHTMIEKGATPWT